MNRWNVQILLEALDDTIIWSLSEEGLEDLRGAIKAGELGRARIKRIEPTGAPSLLAA